MQAEVYHSDLSQQGGREPIRVLNICSRVDEPCERCGRLIRGSNLADEGPISALVLVSPASENTRRKGHAQNWVNRRVTTGKSTVSSYLKGTAYPRIDADLIAVS